MQALEIQEQDFSFLGKGSNVHGVFQFQGPTQLSGSFHGELVMLGEHSLVIGPAGAFKGSIKCHMVEIYGRFEGSIQSPYDHGGVTIYPSAVVTGEIKVNHLVIHPGAIVNIDGETRHEASS